MNNIKKTLKEEKGSTLVEVLLSVAILAIIVAPLLGTVLSAVQNNAASKQRTEAIALAEKVMSEIKSQKSIIPTLSGSAIQYPTTSSGILVPYYKIESEDGSISPSLITTYNYDAQGADNPDLEMIIDQNSTVDGIKYSVTLKDNKIDTSDIILVDLTAATDLLKLKVEKVGLNFSYFLGKKSAPDAESLIPFTPKDINQVKLKVTYTENTVPTSDNQLIIFTNVVSDTLDLFKVYEINNKDANSRVVFVNKGLNEFEVIYIDTDAFNSADPLNKLFKIIVTIKKNGNDIYKTSSYVKK